MGRHRAHLAAALHWPADMPFDWAHALAAGIGMGGPVAIGAATGHVEAGLVASLGGLMMSGVGTLRDGREQAAELGLAAIPAALSTIAAWLLAERGVAEDAVVILLVVLASLAGGYSREAAIVTTRFVLFLLVAGGAVGNSPHDWHPVLLVAGGALLGAAASVILGAIERAVKKPANPAPHAPHRAVTHAQRRAHFLRTLRTLAGWQYTIRLAGCLAIAMVLAHAWPEHHLYWVALTVALLTERAIEVLPVKVTQRALGTFIGVLIAHFVFAWALSAWWLAAVVGVLAAGRAMLRTRNYLAYTVVMTPLVIALLDAGRPPDWGVLADRALATLIGALLVLAANASFRGTAK
jgi:hypothetical protein